jgi:hypothetical protein
MGSQKIMVKAAEMKSQKHKLPMNEMKDITDDEPMNKSKLYTIIYNINVINVTGCY